MFELLREALPVAMLVGLPLGSAAGSYWAVHDCSPATTVVEPEVHKAPDPLLQLEGIVAWGQVDPRTESDLAWADLTVRNSSSVVARGVIVRLIGGLRTHWSGEAAWRVTSGQSAMLKVDAGSILGSAVVYAYIDELAPGDHLDLSYTDFDAPWPSDWEHSRPASGRLREGGTYEAFCSNCPTAPSFSYAELLPSRRA